ncbi:hypothetical protein [Kitasatospora sp. GP82]|uniref:hypothetical protein n=1 Tax=Kitasatospora sp. GP82 TaxID=3035089 RepID=UPI0024771E6E|nr:hypothetical protein [Kitasatospora sp. GP82]MDH6125509.1 hypothetical protein [Kitasatospora sp. GP82]
MHNCPSGGGFFSKLFGRSGEESAPAANATVRDLKGIPHDNVGENGKWNYDPVKRGMLQGQDDDQLLRSVFHPDDKYKTYMTIHSDGHMLEGNHRMAELLERAENGRIDWNEPIYIRGFGG